MSRQPPEFIPPGFVHTDDYDGCREQLINFIEVQLCSGCLDNDLELWNYDWTRRIDPRESGPLHRLALDWFGGKSRENGSHPDFPGIKYSCDVTAYPRPIQEEQERWDRDPYEMNGRTCVPDRARILGFRFIVPNSCAVAFSRPPIPCALLNEYVDRPRPGRF
jgi:hypothetical protein